MKRVLMDQFTRMIKTEFQDLMNATSLSKVPNLKKDVLALEKENLKHYIKNNQMNSERVN